MGRNPPLCSLWFVSSARGIQQEEEEIKQWKKRMVFGEEKHIGDDGFWWRLTPSSLASAREEYFVGAESLFGRSCLGRRVKRAPGVIRRFSTGFGGKSQGVSTAVDPVLRL